MNSKIIVLSRVKHTLLNVININEENINDVIAFNDIERLNATDKFEIMMYLQKQSGNSNMFQEYVKLQDWTDYVRVKKVITIVFDEDIHMAYNKIHNLLSFDDKLNILSQRVYEDTYGLSVVDLLIMEDTSLDSISGGVSGITSNNCSYIEDDIISEVINLPVLMTVYGLFIKENQFI